jgi:hypothetical protein
MGEHETIFDNECKEGSKLTSGFFYGPRLLAVGGFVGVFCEII